MALSSISPQNLHLMASNKMVSEQKGQAFDLASVNVLSSINAFPSPYNRRGSGASILFGQGKIKEHQALL
ncbi:hypothetical protein N9M53_01425 [Alphaproteobacteria bacterium]|nr:hypothetical protein [Alphaproteobacteria bacterium]